MINLALEKLRQNAKWQMTNNNYDELVWLDKEQTKPTKKEVDDEILRLIVEQEQAQFRAERNQLLIEADIEINKLDDLNTDSSSWRAYRQALRDSTESWVLPTKPEGAK